MQTLHIRGTQTRFESALEDEAHEALEGVEVTGGEGRRLQRSVAWTSRPHLQQHTGTLLDLVARATMDILFDLLGEENARHNDRFVLCGADWASADEAMVVLVACVRGSCCVGALVVRCGDCGIAELGRGAQIVDTHLKRVAIAKRMRAQQSASVRRHVEATATDLVALSLAHDMHGRGVRGLRCGGVASYVPQVYFSCDVANDETVLKVTWHSPQMIYAEAHFTC